VDVPKKSNSNNLFALCYKTVIGIELDMAPFILCSSMVMTAGTAHLLLSMSSKPQKMPGISDTYSSQFITEEDWGMMCTNL
jgi:hypothetical protein